MINMIQIMMNASHVLLKSWGEAQYGIRLYNLAQDNISPVKPIHFSEGYESTKLL